MTTLQATWANVARRANKAGDHGTILASSRTAIGIALLVALLVVGMALRVLMFVRLS